MRRRHRLPLRLTAVTVTTVTLPSSHCRHIAVTLPDPPRRTIKWPAGGYGRVGRPLTWRGRHPLRAAACCVLRAVYCVLRAAYSQRRLRSPQAAARAFRGLELAAKKERLQQIRSGLSQPGGGATSGLASGSSSVAGESESDLPPDVILVVWPGYNGRRSVAARTI